MTSDVDVVLVGAGASGGVAAQTLAAAGLSVVCVEQGEWVDRDEFPAERLDWEAYASGRWNPNPNSRALPSDYPCEVSEAEVHPLMFNGVGGSTILYGAQWVRLKPSDFGLRSAEGIADDWPIDYADLAPHYAALERELGVAGMTGDPAYPDEILYSTPPHRLGAIGRAGVRGLDRLGWHWWPHPMAIPSRDHGALRGCVRRGQCEVGCPEGAKVTTDLTHWPVAIAAGARLITGARVCEITTDRRGRATGVHWLDREGRVHHQGGRTVILAANAVGTSRLLLLSTSAVHPDGLANSSGLVGKNLMMHPSAAVTGEYAEPLDSWRGPSGGPVMTLQFYETDESRGFARGAKWEQQNIAGPVNAAGRLGHLPFDERFGEALPARLAASFNHSFEWFIVTEDLPDEANHVSLDSSATDPSGLPAPRITYRVSRDSQRNLEFMTARAHELHAASGATSSFDSDPMPEVGWHLLGTARAGHDPNRSVVDQYGRAHDVPNLFVVDSSVFTTGGAANPTATIMAWARRTALHIAETADRR